MNAFGNKLKGGFLSRIAIVTPTFNRVKFVIPFLTNLKKQTYKEYKLFVVDSGSEDLTVPTFLKNKGTIDVEVISAPPSYWWAAATNSGVKAAIAQGFDLILTINDDASFEADYLERGVESIRTSDFDIIGSRVDFANNKGVIWQMGCHINWSQKYFFVGMYSGCKIEELRARDNIPRYIRPDSMCGNGVFIRADLFRKIGYYQQYFCPHYHSDSEFAMRARNLGYKISVDSELVIYNDWEDGRADIETTLPFFKKYFKVKSPYFFLPSLYFIRRYCPRNIKFQTLFRVLGIVP